MPDPCQERWRDHARDIPPTVREMAVRRGAFAALKQLPEAIRVAARTGSEAVEIDVAPIVDAVLDVVGSGQTNTRPVITIDPAVRFGRPQIRGISAAAIAELVMAGEDTHVVAGELGGTRAEVLTACWWIGLDGPLSYRRLWRNWSNAIHGDLAAGQYTNIPDPPSKEEPADE